MLKICLGALMMALSSASFAACPDLYNHQFDTLQGQKINLCDYQNKPILVVNTASKCGFTPQFEVLESMSSKYKGKLLVIGFPSNDFKQELAGNKEVGEFCIKTYSVKFPMVVKTSVVGANANPLYKEFLKICNFFLHKMIFVSILLFTFAVSKKGKAEHPKNSRHKKTKF